MKEGRLRQWQRALIYSSLGIVFFSAIVVIMWLNASPRVLHIHAPMAVHPSSQKPDQLVFVHFDYCKTLSVEGTVRRFLVSQRIRLPLPIQKDTSKAGCQVVEAPVLIPKEASPDTYTVDYFVEYQVNPLKRVVEEYRSESFKVE